MDVEKALEQYSFQEILDQNGLTEAEVLMVLVNKGHIELPEVLPLHMMI